MNAKYFKVTCISEEEYINKCGEGLMFEQEIITDNSPEAIYVGVDMSEAFEVMLDIPDLERLQHKSED